MARKVAIIGTRGYPSYYGGFETAVRYLAPYLADRNWDVTVYGRVGAVHASDSSAHSGVKSIITSGFESQSLSTLSHGLTATIHAVNTRPDVALVMNVANGYFLPLLRGRKVPTVVNVDGIEWDREKWGSNAKRVFKGGARLTARWADLLVFDAEAIADRWRRDFGATGHFIPYGGSTGSYTEAPVSELGLEPRNYALYVARLVPENSTNEFLAAAETVARDFPVVIVGSSGYGGEIEEQVQRLADSNTNIHWLGHVRDDSRLHALWQHCGVYFHGHSVGGTNPALVQAMALGAPIVARDTPFNTEVLSGAGLLTPPKPQSISNAILQVLRDDSIKQALSQKAITRASTEYTWDSVCERYEIALLSAIGSR